ncbi:MAG TPA: nuclear transport factor 2 family protein [Acidimicrobiales bacterium]|nr:nuclear transport factor 2 family protein [Acidimicrobiales bacterium]
MQDKDFDAVQKLVAKDQIRELVHLYSQAIASRDKDLMVSLYVKDASFGSIGSGEEALRSLMDQTMGDLEFGVILTANHSISFQSPELANGEVWARCFAQNRSEGYYEQLVKYVDEYQMTESEDDGTQVWKFRNRRHLLWFGEGKESPLKLPKAFWPKSNIGIGRLPLSDEAVQSFRKKEALD